MEKRPSPTVYSGPDFILYICVEVSNDVLKSTTFNSTSRQHPPVVESTVRSGNMKLTMKSDEEVTQALLLEQIVLGRRRLGFDS